MIVIRVLITITIIEYTLNKDVLPRYSNNGKILRKLFARLCFLNRSRDLMKFIQYDNSKLLLYDCSFGMLKRDL